MNTSPIIIEQPSTRAELRSRLRRPKYYRIPDGFFGGKIIAATAKRYIPQLVRALPDKYERHVGEKQKAKALRKQLLRPENALALHA